MLQLLSLKKLRTSCRVQGLTCRSKILASILDPVFATLSKNIIHFILLTELYSKTTSAAAEATTTTQLVRKSINDDYFVVVVVAVHNTKCCYHNVIASNLQSQVYAVVSQPYLVMMFFAEKITQHCNWLSGALCCQLF